MLVKLLVLSSKEWTYLELAHDLFMSTSEVHASIKRSTRSQLFDPSLRKPQKEALHKLIFHGIKYVYPPVIGGLSRGLLTGPSHPIISDNTFWAESERYVWPHPQGEDQGMSLSPLYRSVPDAALIDWQLYEAMAMIDAIRVGRARERKIAADYLSKMFEAHGYY